MSDFDYVAAPGTALRKTPRVRRAQFGDGYLQRIADGINNQPAIWDVILNVTEDAADTIEALFEGFGGVESFTWTPPGNKDEITVICSQWSRGYPDFRSVSSITCTFEQVFDIGTGTISALDGGTIDEDSHTDTTADLSIVISPSGGVAPRTHIFQHDIGAGFVDIALATGSSVTDTGLPDDSDIDYRLKTTDDIGAIAYSPTVTVHTDAASGVAFDAASPIQTASNVGAGATPSWTHTPVGTPTGVIVMVDMYTDVGDTAITSITYGGVGLTKAASIADSGDLRCSIWVSTATPSAGAQTVIVNHTDPVGGSYLGAMSITVTGSNPVAQVRGSAATDTGATNTPSAGAVSSASSDLVIGIVAQWALSPVFTATGGQTIVEQGIQAAIGRAFMYAAGAGSVDLSLSSTQSSPWRACTVSIKP